MTTKRFLILVPAIIILFLLQSYLWVPTYEEQTKGNPNRLNEYVTASLGDATLLNPVLSANSASSQIESMVFEGLIDYDEELRFRGRLATSWKVFEEAYFYVNDQAKISYGEAPDVRALVRLLENAKKNSTAFPPKVAGSLNRIESIILLPPEDSTVVKELKATDSEPKPDAVKIHVGAPARIKLVLSEVDQDLFNNLSVILGNDYFSTFDPAKFVTAESPIAETTLSTWAKEILPATEHNPVLIFNLRPNVKFHDGYPFDADDVLFTYEAIMNPKNLSPRVSDYEPVKSVEVLDPLKIRIVYKRLYSPAISTWGMGILPEHLLNAKALKKEAQALGKDPEAFSMRQSRFNRQPVGCGPFTFQEWKSDQFISLNAFEDYWEGPPNYKRYVMRIIPDLLTQEMEFYAGTLDSYNVQPHQVERLKDDPRFQSFSGTSFGYTFIGYNMLRPPFDDVRVRKALGMAIDVNKIIDYVLYGQGENITGPFVKQTDYYNHRIPPLPYDPQGALKLLAEAGFKRNKEGWLERDGKPLQFTLITNSGNDIRKAVLTIAQNAWRQIGIDVRTDLLEWSVFIRERVDKKDFDALVLGWQMPITPDLYQVWHSSQTHPYQLNFVSFKNERADQLIIKIRREYNHAKQVAYCHELHKIIAHEQPYTFLFVGKWMAVLDKRVVIKDIGEDGNMLYKKIKPTKTGSYTFHFNKWIKVPDMPQMTTEGW
ncbi:putative oligopeptide ABC transporter, oligopeptide-binding protein AppA [delta proteobacterium NaphS2]|nr:putative oligopeptide ABC transporter, oligopeptide-binding protein AppA [delta proteobacterium NaphS2]